MLRKRVLFLILTPLILIAQTPSPPPRRTRLPRSKRCSDFGGNPSASPGSAVDHRYRPARPDLLYKVQLQQGATSRALTRADEIHSKLASVDEARARNVKDLEAIQECVNTATDPNKVKECQTALAEKKRSVEIWQSEEQQ